VSNNFIQDIEYFEMATHRALILQARDKPLSLENVAKPTANSGEAVIRVLAVSIVPYMSQVLTGVRPYPLSLPMTPGPNAIGRVESTGNDAVSLAPGQLVYCDATIRGRDDPSITILMGLFGGSTPAAQKLMDGPWRNGTFAEYAKIPLENVFALSEDILLNQMRYSLADLSLLSSLLVPFGGLSEIGVTAGETVIVAPATGKFGGAAVSVAVGMGATVIAAGRNTQALESLKQTFGKRVVTVTLSGNVDTDKQALVAAAAGPADAYIDFSPPEAAGSTHIISSLSALKPFGRAALMGGIRGEISIPYSLLMFNNLRIQGRFMYERKHVQRLIKMVEFGNIKMGPEGGVLVAGSFSLDMVEEAMEAAAEAGRFGSLVVLFP
jgi:D-arabinose 1-dehydrogenase-like Zn-dependent alcohol dehydrogenase